MDAIHTLFYTTIFLMDLKAIVLSRTMSDSNKECWIEIDQQSNSSNGYFGCNGTQVQEDTERQRKLCCSVPFQCNGKNSRRVCYERKGTPECLCEKGRTGEHCEKNFKAKVVCKQDEGVYSIPNCDSIYLNEVESCLFIKTRIQLICESARAINDSQALNLEECSKVHKLRHDSSHNQAYDAVRHTTALPPATTDSGALRCGSSRCIIIALLYYMVYYITY